MNQSKLNFEPVDAEQIAEALGDICHIFVKNMNSKKKKFAIEKCLNFIEK